MKFYLQEVLNNNQQRFDYNKKESKSSCNLQRQKILIKAAAITYNFQQWKIINNFTNKAAVSFNSHNQNSSCSYSLPYDMTSNIKRVSSTKPLLIITTICSSKHNKQFHLNIKCLCHNILLAIRRNKHTKCFIRQIVTKLFR